jgi:hypothetical protein
MIGLYPTKMQIFPQSNILGMVESQSLATPASYHFLKHCVKRGILFYQCSKRILMIFYDSIHGYQIKTIQIS